MPNKPCAIGCGCGLHSSTSSRFSGRAHPHSSKVAMRTALEGKQRDPEQVQRSSDGLKKWHNSLTPEQKLARGRAISAGDPRSSTSGRLGWTGGQAGEDFAAVLCPVGFVREHQVNWASGPSAHYKLDFAHVLGKVNIELDGPYHDGSNDRERDARLRSLGWKVIRIRHA